MYTLSAAPDSLAAFKAANVLRHAPWHNRLRLQVPARSWRAGETRQYYL